MNRPHDADITGTWTPADDTKNTVEVAPTSRDNLLAFRNTYDPQEVTFVTKTQLRNLAESLQRGPMQNLIR